jgi:choline dehydrogenase
VSRVYDVVVVGAGSAGCVLAGRLTEDPDRRVLLLEAGPPDDADEVRIPAAFFQLFKTARDWDYTTEEQKQLLGRRLYWPRGRMLGGSSSLNAMIYIRGARADYDGWGVPGWGYDDLLPYFLRAEDNGRGASAWHGAGEPDPGHQRVGDDGEVRPAQRRAQVGVRGRPPPTSTGRSRTAPGSTS